MRRGIPILSFVTLAFILVLLVPPPYVHPSGSDIDIGKELFQTSDRCIACHNGLITSTGEDISIGFSWRPTMMANSARDPYWQASVRRETIDHPESTAAVEDECAICHMPMARYQSRYENHPAKVFMHLDDGSDDRMGQLARDGVSCSMCHQIGKENLGTRDSFVGGFVVDTTKQQGERAEFGPYKIDDGQNRIMRTSSGGYLPAESDHVRKSELCATCHTLITKALGPDGRIVGQLPEQMPYQEWFNSEFRETQSCQNCHMPVVEEDTPIANTLGKPREQVARHAFVGGNFFMLRVLNRYRQDLGVTALPQEFEAAANRTINYLKDKTAQVSIDRVSVSAGRLEAEISVQNLGGHKFPTAYPSRRAWLHVTVRDRNGIVIFESGALNPDGSIQGNDNDTDGGRFEVHHTEIDNPDQVQIYEDIMVGTNNVPTTGLLNAVRFIKDNRLLPKGFDKTVIEQEIAPQGEAATDGDFIGGGDRIRYAVPADSSREPYQIEAELWFQPISYRWATNLKPFNAPEPERFAGYYEAMSSGSALMLVRATATGGQRD